LTGSRADSSAAGPCELVDWYLGRRPDDAKGID